MAQRFSGKVALVTGGAAGIGLACVKALIGEGARVVIADRDERALESQVAPLGDRVHGKVADVTDPSSCDAMVAFALAEFGRLDVAVNNAGIGSGFDNDFSRFDLNAWNNVIATNLNGVFYSMRAEAAAMEAAEAGAIVNIGSVASLVAKAGMASYVAAKHGLGGLTKAAALDLLKSGIRVNIVCLGLVRTEQIEALMADPDIAATILKDIPMGRAAEPAEVAKAVLFLASSDSSYATGSTLTLDGGLTLQ